MALGGIGWKFVQGRDSKSLGIMSVYNFKKSYFLRNMVVEAKASYGINRCVFKKCYWTTN